MKIDGWEYKFDMFMEKAYSKEFEWGSWDCCKFADACLTAISNKKSYIPKQLNWTDEKSAIASIKKYGGTLNKSIAKAFKNKLDEVNKDSMMRGDLAVYKEESELVGMTDGAKIIGPSDGGLSFKKSTDVEILSVWRLPL